MQRRNDRAADIAVADIAADINAYLMQFGKKPVSENSVLSNLRTASLYLQAALGVALVPDRKTMTVQFIDAYETAENIERYFDQIKSKLQKLGSQVKHADACGYDVSHVLQAAEDATGGELLAGSAEA